MTLTDLLIPTYRQMLQTLIGLLEKAERQASADSDAFPSARLASDMLPLSAQFRFAAYQAQEAVYRLRGEPVPDQLHAVATEGRNAGDAPGSTADARVCLEQALAFLDSVPANALDAGATIPITLELPGSLTFDMTGEQYARDWALPQFYFHVITAYAILRSQGVEIGKADYVPHMFAYLRPGSMPEGRASSA